MYVLRGLIWPNAPEILAKTALEHNTPFILSIVSTESIERIGEITEVKAWFQLYHPAQEEFKIDLIRRSAAVGDEIFLVFWQMFPVLGLGFGMCAMGYQNSRE